MSCLVLKFLRLLCPYFLTLCQDHIAVVYHMKDVNASLNLTRRDLVAFALLSAGDFSSGVPNIREKKFTELMKEFKINKIEDALDRYV